MEAIEVVITRTENKENQFTSPVVTMTGMAGVSIALDIGMFVFKNNLFGVPLVFTDRRNLRGRET